jgi:hypothetical protein
VLNNISLENLNSVVYYVLFSAVFDLQSTFIYSSIMHDIENEIILSTSLNSRSPYVIYQIWHVVLLSTSACLFNIFYFFSFNRGYHTLIDVFTIIFTSSALFEYTFSDLFWQSFYTNCMLNNRKRFLFRLFPDISR